METLEAIIKIGGAITGVLIIWRAVVAIVHFNDRLKKIQEHSEENYLTGLRLTVMSHDMPIGERIAAGKKYIEAGGNGEVKTYIINELHVNDVIDK